MTIPTVTDDLLREIEEAAGLAKHYGFTVSSLEVESHFNTGFYRPGDDMPSVPVSALEHLREKKSVFDPATILALTARIRDLEKDAARYRWLRDRIENTGDMVIAKCSEWSIKSWSGDDPDSAIDAAMQAYS